MNIEWVFLLYAWPVLDLVFFGSLGAKKKSISGQYSTLFCPYSQKKKSNIFGAFSSQNLEIILGDLIEWKDFTDLERILS